jgi:hypothetical protein
MRTDHGGNGKARVVVRGGYSRAVKHSKTIEDGRGVQDEIHKDLLSIDPEYQRAPSVRRVRALVDTWSWGACGVLNVARRNGTLSIVDGQHRWLAALQRPDIETLPCIVFDVDNMSEEARMFFNANCNRGNVPGLDKYRSLLKGGDQIAVAVQDAFDILGLKVAVGCSGGSITCVMWCMKRAKENYRDFAATLTLAADLCKDTVIKERLLDGLYYLHQHCESLEDKRFRARILHVGEEMLVEGATRQAKLYVEGGNKVFASGMLIEINRNLRHADKYHLRVEER